MYNLGSQRSYSNSRCYEEKHQAYDSRSLDHIGAGFDEQTETEQDVLTLIFRQEKEVWVDESFGKRELYGFIYCCLDSRARC